MRAEVHTPRLLLRSWRCSDAARLLPILERNVEHLRRWIPERVYAPAAIPELEQRLAVYAADFEADRAWRYAMFLRHDGELAGEASLFARSSEGRVPLACADRVEIGYWLREDLTGRGLATEAAEALLGVATRLPGIGCVEIRCDSRNRPSAAVPRRLGFTIAENEPAAESTGQVWRRALAASPEPGTRQPKREAEPSH